MKSAPRATIILYKVVLAFQCVYEILKCDHSMNATRQYFLVALFIMPYMFVVKSLWLKS